MTKTKFPPAIFCIGRNYADHAAEMGSEPLEHPIVFMKNPASLIGDGDSIVIPSICSEPREQVDFEGELAVIIGKDCRDVVESESLSFVSGYAAANDVSARWWQKLGSGGQYVRGKSFDTFCPIGPVKPASEVGDPQQLQLTTKLNGEEMQSASTATMIFPIKFLVAELSRGMTLQAGTVLLTGTPSGVGAARRPQRFLNSGDEIEVIVEGVGNVKNRVA